MAIVERNDTLFWTDEEPSRVRRDIIHLSGDLYSPKVSKRNVHGIVRLGILPTFEQHIERIMAARLELETFHASTNVSIAYVTTESFETVQIPRIPQFSHLTSSLLQNIEDAWTRGQEDDFNEDGYEPILEETKQTAMELALMFGEFDTPDVLPMKSGRIGFKWQNVAESVLLSVGTERQLYLSSITADSRMSGIWTLQTKIPGAIREQIFELMSGRIRSK